MKRCFNFKQMRLLREMRARIKNVPTALTLTRLASTVSSEPRLSPGVFNKMLMECDKRWPVALTCSQPFNPSETHLFHHIENIDSY